MRGDRSADGSADIIAYSNADLRTYSITDSSTQCSSDCCADRSTNRDTVISTDGLTDRHADTAPLRHRHALLLAQHA